MATPSQNRQRTSWLDAVERVGNMLPEPVLLFVLLAGAVIVMSAVGSGMGWSVQPVRPTLVTEPVLDDSGAAVIGADGAAQTRPVLDAGGKQVVSLVASGNPVTARSLATSDGVYWMLSSMLRNFTSLPALGLIFVAMLGIGLAEKFGFFACLMRFLSLRTPAWLLTPVIVFIGTNASVASDAGYIILPPLAAALYQAMGRPPIAGLAAAFAGVSGGFGAGFFPTGGDGALTGFAQDAARIIDPAYSVNILHNFYFKGASAIVVTLAGWFVTDRIVEPRLVRSGAASAPGGPGQPDTAALASMDLTRVERRALWRAGGAMAAVVSVFLGLILVPGMPLHGAGQPALADGRVLVHHEVTIAGPGAGVSAAASDVLSREPLVVVEAPVRGRLPEAPGARWSHVIVPMIFLVFLTPGVVFGMCVGTLRSQRDLVEGLYHGIRLIVPVLAIAFFMAQFVNYFAYSRLDRMLAYSGGALLARAEAPIPVLLVLFVLLVVFGDFAISGMLSKFGVLAPIFIPMFMMAGMSPELTTAAYRIGDSVVNIITPLNSYLLIILAVFQRYRASVGLGSLISLMLPYSIVFGVVWTALLVGWYLAGLPVGPGAPLRYVPAP